MRWPAPSPLRPGLDVLLVEDQMLVAMDVETMLTEAGVGRIRTATTASEGLARLREAAPDVAVLDIDLGQATSIPVAEELHRRGIPFVFATGYDEAPELPEAFRAVALVRKPYDRAALATAIAAALGRS